MDAAALLRDYLADRDVGCPRCGYNLRNLQTDRCPECGDAIRLNLALVEPRQGAYLAMLAASCVATGGSALFLLLALTQAPAFWWWESISPWLLLLQLILFGGLLLICTARRRAVLRRPRDWQWAWATIAWITLVVLWLAIIVFFDG